jgi:putative transposase
MQIAHKIELKPNNKQKTYFAKASGVARFSYNWALAEWNRIYEENKKLPKEERQTLSGMSLKKSFNALKKEKFPWTKEVTKYAAQQPFLDLQEAFGRFFKKLGGRPQFKKKGKANDSFYVGGDQVKIRGRSIHVPNLGLVRLKESPRFVGKINSATFSRAADKWFVSLQFDVEDQALSKNLNCPKSDRHVAVDVGLEHMAVTSDGHAFKPVMPLKKYLRKLKREQRVMAKKIQVAKKEGRKLSESKNFQKQKLKVAKIHYKVSCIRKDTLHKLTSFLANNYTSIAIEDLNVKGMSKNHRLARSILDVGFGEFRRQLAYKTAWRGTEIVVVDRFFPSSKTCSVCGVVKEKMPLKDRTFTCECGNVMQRDFNASLNLKQKIGRVPAEFTPVEITAMRRVVYPLVVTSIVESGKEHQKLCG